jgi:hypothetical protein
MKKNVTDVKLYKKERADLQAQTPKKALIFGDLA